MQNYLFLGGAQNGLNIPVADDVVFVQLADDATGRETYIRDALAVGIDGEFAFYRHEELGPEEVLDLLVKHYKAWAVNQPASRR